MFTFLFIFFAGVRFFGILGILFIGYGFCGVLGGRVGRGLSLGGGIVGGGLGLSDFGLGLGLSDFGYGLGLSGFDLGLVAREDEAIDSGMDAGGVGGVFLEVAEQGFELGVVEGSGFVLKCGGFAPIVERVSCGVVIETHFEKVVELGHTYTHGSLHQKGQPSSGMTG